MRDSFKVYGFDFPHNGRRFTFRVLAHSAEEAQAQAEAMRSFTYVGELKPVDPSCILPQTDDSAAVAVA